MARYKPTVEPWPQGQPTRRCDDCQGTGMNMRAFQQQILSHKPQPTDPTTVRCRYCAGRGRVLVNEPKGANR